MDDTSIDFLVLAPVEVEIEALQDILGWEKKDQVYQGYKYFTSVIPRDGCEPARVRVVRLPYQGVLMAAVPACRLIDAWRPDCVVSFGIMGGFLGDDIKLCDVLLADGAFYYEPGKEAVKGSFRPDPKPYCTSPFTKFCAEGFDERGCESDFEPCPGLPADLIAKASEWCGEGRPRVTRGWLASGEKLVADASGKSRKLILDLMRHVRGVEMEAAGVAEAVRTSVSITPALLIVKGVSDPAGEGKQRLGSFRRPAARNAAMCLKSVIANSTRLQRSREWIPASLILKQASWVVSQLEPALYYPPQRSRRSAVLEEWKLAIARALRSNKRPPVFYQWRIWNRGVHWIDFYFLLFLRRLRDRSDKSAIELPIEVLVADKNDRLSGEVMQAGKLATTHIVEHLLGSKVVQFQTAAAELTEADYWASDSGLTFAVREQLRTLLYSMDARHDAVDETWIQYMAYTARAAQSCIVLNWYKRSSIAHFLNFVLSVTPVILPTPDLGLGKGVGKRDGPGKDLIIDPPSYKETLEWTDRLLCEKGAEKAKGFFTELEKYLTCPGYRRQISEDELEKLLANHPDLLRSVKNGNDFMILRSLFGTFLAWNEKFGFDGAEK